MVSNEEEFKKALEGKNIPILILDHKWHQIFINLDVSGKIVKLRDELTELLKEQGKCNTEGKEIKKLKTKLMNDIVVLVDENDTRQNKKTEKLIAEHSRLLDDCNEKLESYREALLELPKKINDVNYELMLATMDVCYHAFDKNSVEIEEIGEWISTIRVELKKKVIRKQEKESENQVLYTFMHNIFGPEVIEIFDVKYDIEKQIQNKLVELKENAELID